MIAKSQLQRPQGLFDKRFHFSHSYLCASVLENIHFYSVYIYLSEINFKQIAFEVTACEEKNFTFPKKVWPSKEVRTAESMWLDLCKGPLMTNIIPIQHITYFI